MPDSTPDYRLQDLQQRLKLDPASRVFRQLAEEYRKHGQVAEAVEVLEKGLEHRPNDLSAQVALGRCRKELGRLDDAVAPLEAVLARDPAHLVANKLLVEVHLLRDDPEHAGERLEIYRLLNDRDPELDHLEYRLRSLRSDAAEAASEPSALEEPTLEELIAEPVEEPPAAPEPAAPEPEPAAPEPEPVASPAAEAAPDVAVPALEAATPAGPSTDDEIFPLPPSPPPPLDDLWVHSAAEERARQRAAEPFGAFASASAAELAREGIFAGGDEAVPAVAEVTATPSEPPAPESEPVVEVAEPAASAFEPEPFALEPAPAPAFEPEPFAPEPVQSEPEPFEPELAAPEPAAPELAALEPMALEPEPVAPEPEPEPIVPEPEPELELAAPEPIALEPEPLEAPEPEPVVMAEPPLEQAAAAEQEEEATATLGELYLEQGHSEEAERIFREVLERDPGNSAALAGLDRLHPRAPKELTAADLLADRAVGGLIPEGLTAKKVMVLGNYIKHLRTGGQSHVH